jgi:hypothetical protein
MAENSEGIDQAKIRELRDRWLRALRTKDLEGITWIAARRRLTSNLRSVFDRRSDRCPEPPVRFVVR